MTEKKPPSLKLVSSAGKAVGPTKPGSKGKGGGGPGRGQPPHVPTDATRMLVSLGLGSGYTLEQVSRVIGISIMTLKSHYETEIEDGGSKINLKIAANLAMIASNPNHPKAVTAAIYWTKARMGWMDDGADDEKDDDETPVEFTIGIGEKRGPAAS